MNSQLFKTTCPQVLPAGQQVALIEGKS
jgi:hypothetical protein